MSKLFAGIGPDGALRFIGDVPRGAACNCTCPECRSPLVAKQGSLEDWHFAHEAGQERPDCEAGAVNVLRRLAIEHLKSRPGLKMPTYVRPVIESSKRREWREDARWEAQFAGALDWIEGAARDTAVATGRLDTGVKAELHVHVGDDGPPVGSGDAPAAVALWCPMAALADLRDRNLTERHIATAGRFVWLQHPDIEHVVDTVRRRLREQAAAADAADEKERAARAAIAGRRWASIGRGLSAAPEQSEQSIQSRRGHRSLSTRRNSTTGRPSARCTPRSSSIASGTAARGVMYEMDDGGTAIAPWPKDEGWDKSLPPSVGVADVSLGVYRATSMGAAMSFLGERHVKLYVSSSPQDFEGR